MRFKQIASMVMVFAGGVAVGGWGASTKFSRPLGEALASNASLPRSASPATTLSVGAPRAAAIQPGSEPDAKSFAEPFERAPEAPALPDKSQSIEQQRAASQAYRAFVSDETARLAAHASWVKRRLFEHEGVDPEWAAQLAPRIQRKYAEEQPFGNAVVESLECRVTVCQLVVYSADQQFMQGARLQPGTLPTYLLWNVENDVEQNLNPDHTGFRATVWMGDDFEEGVMRRMTGQVQMTTIQQAKGTDGGRP